MTYELYVAWQSRQSRAWYPVGLLEYEEGHGYTFRYVCGAQVAGENEGFPGIGQFPDFETTYQSDTLFAFFRNRIMSPARSDFAEVVERVGLQPVGDVDDPAYVFQYLNRTKGWRATDNFEMFAPPAKRGNTLVWEFFTRGLRHADPVIQTRWQAGSEEPSAPLNAMLGPKNEHDSHSVLIVDAAQCSLGYVPRYYSKQITEAIRVASDVEIEVLRHNREEWLVQQRFLLKLTVAVPASFELKPTPELEPISPEHRCAHQQ